MHAGKILHVFIVASLLDGDLKDVDALRDVRMELNSKKEVCYFRFSFTNEEILLVVCHVYYNM